MNVENPLTSLINSVCKYKSVSIIGLEKNTGKTTTLNFLIKNSKNEILGITSIGVDGEDKSIIKPRIHINADTLVATAKSSLLQSDVTFEILSVLDINTPLGPIVIARSVTSGFVEISGASTKNGTKHVLNILHEYGATLTLVDGALSRKTFADPCITEASILCIGAAFSEDINVLVKETSKLVCFFSIEKVNIEIYKLYEEIMDQYKLAFIYQDKVLKSDLKTVIGASKEIQNNINDKLRYIFIKGIITNSLLEDILASNFALNQITFVIEDGTKLFLNMEVYLKFLNKGGSLKVLNPINIIGVSVNPQSSSGYCLDYNEIEKKLRTRIKVSIFNVLNHDWR